MHISRLSIKGVRCFTAVDLQFSSAVNIFVGVNNSGKTSLLYSLLDLQSARLSPDDLRYGLTVGKVDIWLEDPDRELFERQLQKAIPVNPGNAVQIRVDLNRGNANSKRMIVDGSNIEFHPFADKQPNNFLVPYLANRRTDDLKASMGTQYAYPVSGTLGHLQAKIDRVYTSPKLRPQFEEACLDVIGFLISTYQVESGKAAGLEVDAVNVEYIPIAKMGSGVVAALGLIVELLTARNKVFVIEEIENDLHPKALRSLLRLIEAAATNGCQFFLSTHSSVVLRHLGSVPNSKIFQLSPVKGDSIPTSAVCLVEASAKARREILVELGYEMSDYDLYDSWLLLEESSAERIIREFLIPWFVPSLSGRLRTISANGAQDVEPKFDAFYRLFVFLHLETSFQMRAWVYADGDSAGVESTTQLKKKFQTWPAEHFCNFKMSAFEHYYPSAFDDRIRVVLAIENKAERRAKKQELLLAVVDYLRTEVGAKESLKASAGEIIDVLSKMSALIIGPH